MNDAFAIGIFGTSLGLVTGLTLIFILGMIVG